MLLFYAILIVALDFYVFFALRGSSIPFAKKIWFGWLWWGYSIMLLIGLFTALRSDFPFAYRSGIVITFIITTMCKFSYGLVLVTDDIRRGGVWISRFLFPKKEKETPSPQLIGDKQRHVITRSDFLLKSGLVVASLPFFGLSWGVISGAYDYRIRRQKLYLPNLPQTFHGMTIAQISDVHSGSFYNKKAVSGGIELLMGEKPDMIFFTGDLVNHLASEMWDYQDLFSKLKADLGVFSVLGNHDYGDYYFGYGDSPEKHRNLKNLVGTHKVMGWDLLRNENRKVKVDNETISIVGVENWGTRNFSNRGNIQKALLGTEEEAVKLLLSHDPSHWREQVLDTDVDAMFAGHTHGMQFGVRSEHFQWSPVQYIYKEWAGLYSEGNKQLYVNAGFGFLGYPGRVGILPEITIFELQKGSV